ncbi:MAG: c-type cytochrome [Deltaproteobacteria bacterium]|nr:c-type cytochrome [Deltaproteobacteria bacterium]
MKNHVVSLSAVAIAAAVFAGGAACVPAAMAADASPAPMPLGLQAGALRTPADNPITTDKVELGKLLFFDTRLSKDGTINCATCHAPEFGFAEPRKVSTGIGGAQGGRNAPTAINSGFSFFQFWDGRAPNLEEQAKGPIANPIEMGHTLEDATKAIASVPGYKPLFKAAFGDETVTTDRIAQAIASFERTLLSGNSAWDRFAVGHDESALSDSAKRGLRLFEGKAKCSLCHAGFSLSDGIFHNLGVGMAAAEPDLGRFKVTGQPADKGAFKTPTLRDISKTAPYMHDGSQATLEEVVDFYNKGGEANPTLDVKVVKLDLSAQDKADLVAFMKSLDGDWKFARPTASPK